MRRLVVPLDLFVAVSALLGGVSLAPDPSGGRLGMPVSFLVLEPEVHLHAVHAQLRSLPG